MFMFRCILRAMLFIGGTRPATTTAWEDGKRTATCIPACKGWVLGSSVRAAHPSHGARETQNAPISSSDLLVMSISSCRQLTYWI